MKDYMRDELMSVFISFVGAGDNKTLRNKRVIGIHLCWFLMCTSTHSYQNDNGDTGVVPQLELQSFINYDLLLCFYDNGDTGVVPQHKLNCFILF